jgi:hypothetical protein
LPIQDRGSDKRQSVPSVRARFVLVVSDLQPDPMVSVRTWQNVLDEIIGIKTGPTQARWKSAAKDKAFVPLLPRILIETQAEHLLAVLRAGAVSTNAFLRKVHNFAVDMNWLSA